MIHSICQDIDIAAKICGFCNEGIYAGEECHMQNGENMCEHCTEIMKQHSVSCEDDLPCCKHCGAGVYPSGSLSCNTCMRLV